MTTAQSEFCISLAFFSYPLLPLYPERRISSHQHRRLDWNERVSSRCYYSCDLLHHQRHHHQLEPTAWLLRITTIMLSSTWFSYSSLQPTTTPTIKHIFLLSFTNKGLQQQKNRPPFHHWLKDPSAPTTFFFFCTPSSSFIHFPSLFGLSFLRSSLKKKAGGRRSRATGCGFW